MSISQYVYDLPDQPGGPLTYRDVEILRKAGLSDVADLAERLVEERLNRRRWYRQWRKPRR